jgi:hypothetical protein
MSSKVGVEIETSINAGKTSPMSSKPEKKEKRRKLKSTSEPISDSELVSSTPIL